MMKLQKIYIDYSIFDRYDEEVFKEYLVLPIYEDDIVFKFAICKNSKLVDLKLNFDKQMLFEEVEQNEIEFFLSHLSIRKDLNTLAKQSMTSSENDNSLKIFFEKLIDFSVKARASDIHIESSEQNCFIRLRIDGRIKTFFVFENKLFRYISSYIKLISNLDITQTRLPMDSRFSLDIASKIYDFRVSTMPTINSESIVLRILDKTNINKNLDDLGFDDNIFLKLKKILNLSQGLVLIAGPTGSGKTTTLYSLLKEIKNEEKKIITVEDPVEYKISDISQISVNNKIGLSFELILKNILRQDPDIIFIGEIRDEFSLNIALQASLTGHLVFATIHSNSAVGTISRLIDLKADSFLLSSTLKYVLSQRLVLNYCKTCNGVGCEKCNFTKFYDRSCIAELLEVDDKISSQIFNKVQTNEIENYLKQTGFKSILEDAMQKVKENITSKEEVYKVL